jgi:hypothetical protein
MAETFVANRAALWELAVEDGPGLFAVTRTSIRQIDLDD